MNYQRKGVYEIRRRALRRRRTCIDMCRRVVDNIVQDVMDDYLVEGLHPEHWNVSGMRENLERVFDCRVGRRRRRAARHVPQRAARPDEERGSHAKLDSGGRATWARTCSREYSQMLLLQLTDTCGRTTCWRSTAASRRRAARLRSAQPAARVQARSAADVPDDVGDARRVADSAPAPHRRGAGASAAAQQPGKRTARKLEQRHLPTGRRRAQGRGSQSPNRRSRFPQSGAAEPTARPSQGRGGAPVCASVRVARNDPCPCGSGKKYKRCCYEANWKAPVEDGSERVRSGPSAEAQRRRRSPRRPATK